VHGGAVLPSGTSNIGYHDRRALNAAAKSDMGRRAARRIPDGSSVFLNIGTSTEAVARALLTHRDLLVVTDNMNVANILVDNPDCDILVAGGTLRRSDGGLVGDLTTQTIAQFKFDIAVIGCSALDHEGDLLDFNIQEAGVSRTILRQARRVFLVADHSKFQRRAPARIASLADLSVFVTDAPPPGNLVQRCADWGVVLDLPQNGSGD
jgi:DeoR family glycerol-3-phosphate regulon repressor